MLSKQNNCRLSSSKPLAGMCCKHSTNTTLRKTSLRDSFDDNHGKRMRATSNPMLDPSVHTRKPGERGDITPEVSSSTLVRSVEIFHSDFMRCWRMSPCKVS